MSGNAIDAATSKLQATFLFLLTTVSYLVGCAHNKPNFETTYELDRVFSPTRKSLDEGYRLMDAWRSGSEQDKKRILNETVFADAYVIRFFPEEMHSEFDFKLWRDVIILRDNKIRGDSIYIIDSILHMMSQEMRPDLKQHILEMAVSLVPDSQAVSCSEKHLTHNGSPVRCVIDPRILERELRAERKRLTIKRDIYYYDAESGNEIISIETKTSAP